MCKRLAPRTRRDESARQALAAEAQLLEVLEGRGAPRFAGSGDDPYGPYVLIEWIPLPSVGRRMARDGALRAAWIEVAAPTAFAALARVHECSDAVGPLNVVHGDLGPHNVLVSDDGRDARIVDFGLARSRLRPALGGAFRGTLAYTAPELARGEPADGRADLFSLAAALLHAASGRSPRPHGGAAAALLAAGTEPVDGWARDASRDLPPALRSALLACVAFDARDRPPRARDVVRSAP